MESTIQNNSLTQLQNLAEKILKNNSSPQGYLAGSTHFADLWARDALYACLGGIAISDWETVERTLHTLAKHQKSGQIPLRVGRTNIMAAILGLPSPKGAIYRNDKNSNPALDPNSLFVIIACILEIQRPGNNYTETIQSSLAWLATQKRESLLRERSYASWDDAIKKNGASIYNNALYIYALRLAAQNLDAPALNRQADESTQALEDTLWNGRYYQAWEGEEALDVCGNLLAITMGVTNSSRSKKILTSIEKWMSKEDDSLPKLNYPAYASSHTYLPFRLIGMGDYHNQGPYWSWLAAALAMAYRKTGEVEKSTKILEELQKWTCEESIHEIYDGPAQPTKRLIYSSEKDFSWTAGLILAATSYNGSSLRPSK